MLPQVQVRREGEDYADQILSKAVKAGRRTYFFDVRATRGDDYFLTITESRKITGPDGSATYDRHKIFVQGGLHEIRRGIQRGRRIHPPHQRDSRAGEMIPHRIAE